MNRILVSLSVAAFSIAASAQTAAPKAATAAKPASASTKPASTAAKPAATASQPPLTPWIRLPKGVPVVAHGPVKMPFALRYEDIKVGPGALGEPGKVWHLKYTGWRAADGVKFDSWDDHRQPEMGPDGKVKLGPDGKPVMSDPKPIEIPIGVGRVIPGFDYGLDGMKIGGKRRIFIPWQMAYGTRAIPDRPDHPGIPAKSDLIFDVELLDVTAAPQPPMMPPGGRPMPMPPHPGTGAPNGAPAPKPAAPSGPGTTSAPNTGSSPGQSAPATPPPATTQTPAPPPATTPQPK